MRLKKLTFILAGVLVSTTAAGDMAPCEALYLEGVEHFEQGHYDEAAERLAEAISLSPEPRADDEYLPYAFLAAARFHQGNMRLSRDALVQSQVYGVAAATDRGQALLNQYAEAIMAADPVDRNPPAGPQASPVAVASLTDLEAQQVRARVLKRCALSNDVAENRLPWYFHYLLGLEFTEEGDSGRALEAFQLGANIRESSARNKRLYGMWFLDYLPYYQIARLQAEQGDWSGAHDALRMSEQAGEFSPDDKDFDRFKTLDQQVKSQLAYSDS